MKNNNEEIHNTITGSFEVFHDTWAKENVDRVVKNLTKIKPELSDTPVHILRAPIHTAFVTIEQQIYVSHRLLELCADDAVLAFIISHEFAHLKLGHLDYDNGWISEQAPEFIDSLVGMLKINLNRLVNGCDDEAEADLYALRLCIQAGYDAENCLKIFDILEKVALDHGDIEGVYGPDSLYEDLHGEQSWSDRLEIWWYYKNRGYLPVIHRKKVLLDMLKEDQLDQCG